MKWAKPKEEKVVMHVGKYAGTPVDQLPVSYCRWLISQKFPEDILEAARAKVEATNESADLTITVSRHALDMFSLRFLVAWQEARHPRGEKPLGLASFVAKEADKAWELGKTVRSPRHQDDGIAKEYKGIVWIFIQSPTFPEYKDVITLYQAKGNQWRDEYE